LDGADAMAAAEAIAAAKGFLDAGLLHVIDRLEDTGTLTEHGWTSAKDYLTHLLGAHKGTGGGLLRTIQQLRGLPAVRDALDTGQITLPQARAIASQVTTLPRVPEFRTTVASRLLALAVEGHDATDLTTAFTDVVHHADPTGEIVNADKERARNERGAHGARHLSIVDDGRGGVRIKGYGTTEDAERIKATLHPLAAPVTSEPGACGGVNRGPGEPTFDDHGHATQTPCLTPGCGHDGKDPREAGARLWDALVDACDRLANSDDLPRDHGTKPRVIVLIDQDSLKQQVIDAGLARPGHTPTGTRLSASAVRRLACDAEIIPGVLGTHGQVLDVGRAHRLVTPAIWTALVIRDRHCAFPGCTRMPLACDAHHITHWADGGTTSLDNLIMVCRHHHVLLHQTPWAVHIDPHTGQPVWTPPPRASLHDLRTAGITYAPSRPPGTSPPRAA
ncbi:MAG TPA: DUF222 domain-containing protein, partial [Nocardioides sp.]|nr:DUF222 domain-containing protein [Nocardioides sp.]